MNTASPWIGETRMSDEELELRAHPWHNQIFGYVNVPGRLEEIHERKGREEWSLRERLMAIVIPGLAVTELNAVQAKWAPEFDAVYTKWQPGSDVVHAKWELELNAVRAKRQLELDAVHARYCDPQCPWDGRTIFTHKDADDNWCMKDEGHPVEPLL